MKIGFIGLGNMARAIIGGILKDKIIPAKDIIGSDKFEAARKNAAKDFKITAVDSNIKVVEESDILFFAVKPQFLPEVLEEIKGSVKKETVIVSIVAGKTIGYLEDGLKVGNSKTSKVKIVRCMPNTPALVGEGCTGVSPNANVTKAELEKVLKILSSFGKAHVVSEKLMDAVGAVSGSSPAFVFMFIEAMADGAVAGGMPRAQAYEFAAQAVLGSAKLVLETGKHPGELKDMVCSPGGTTIEGVKVLEECGMRGAIMDAMEAVIEKTKQL
ncbi:MAG: pyrroline-5-carboxylate reductase [Lachnospiraceae bacterium]|nr:pyrroline-5-carboxylate reductase [Lachnospiraceae bacterium]